MAGPSFIIAGLSAFDHGNGQGICLASCATSLCICMLLACHALNVHQTRSQSSAVSKDPNAAEPISGHDELANMTRRRGGGGKGYLCREVSSTLSEARLWNEAAVRPQQLRACNGLLFSDFFGISLIVLARTLTHLHAVVEMNLA